MVPARFLFASTLLLLSSLVIVSAIDYSQGSEQEIHKPKPIEQPLHIGVEGHILCKSSTSSSAVPIQGAVARITCLAVDEYGYETAPFSFLSGETDANGYFFATLCPSQLNHKLQLSQCKAFLKKSPLEDCNVPTDVNKGVRGAILKSYRVLDQSKMRLYWLAPFYYTSQSYAY